MSFPDDPGLSAQVEDYNSKVTERRNELNSSRDPDHPRRTVSDKIANAKKLVDADGDEWKPIQLEIHELLGKKDKVRQR